VKKFVQPKDKFDIKKVNNIKFKAFSKIMMTKTTSIRYFKERVIPKEINIKELDKLKLDHS